MHAQNIYKYILFVMKLVVVVIYLLERCSRMLTTEAFNDSVQGFFFFFLISHISML